MESNQSNAAAVRAFRVLEVVGQHPDGCSLAAIVGAFGLPKQKVHRIVGQLQFSGLLMREPGTRKVQLASRVEHFALAALMNGPGRSQRHAILRGLVDAIGETCNLAALAGTEIVYLDRVETTWPLRLMLAPGSHVPLHATSSGKLLLSLLPKPQRDRLVNQLTLRSFTESTIVEPRALKTLVPSDSASRRASPSSVVLPIPAGPSISPSRGPARAAPDTNASSWCTSPSRSSSTDPMLLGVPG
jgi:DNA-binding IclR family transcriptional regulator